MVLGTLLLLILFRFYKGYSFSLPRTMLLMAIECAGSDVMSHYQVMSKCLC